MKKINRKEFLQKAGIGIVSGPFILSGLSALTQESLKASPALPFNCVLAPTSTGGPFYLDPSYNRKNITEEQAGLPTKIRIQVLGVDNCAPVPNAIVNIWHCNIRGVYSEFGKIYGNLEDASNEKWLRGYQTTDAEGWCEFETVFPGWYPGRATHIHYDVHIGFTPGGEVNSTRNPSSTFMSQMYFPDDLRTKVYTEVDAYQSRGDNTTSNGRDGIFNGEQELMLSVDQSDYPNAISANFCIGLDMAGTPTPTQDIKGKSYFELDYNHPNPFSSKTAIAFRLKTPGTTILSIFNPDGELVEQLINKRLAAGDYQVEFHREKARDPLAAGNYLFEMMVHNKEGRFRQSRKMVII